MVYVWRIVGFTMEKRNFKTSKEISSFMTWEKYDIDNPHQRARPVQISRSLFQAIQRFTEEKDIKKQQCFEIALTNLWRIWNNYSKNEEPASPVTELTVKNILINNPMPKDAHNDGRKYYAHIHFKGKITYKFIKELEKLHVIRGLEDGIKRILSWFLREQGYLEKLKKPVKDESSEHENISLIQGEA